MTTTENPTSECPFTAAREALRASGSPTAVHMDCHPGGCSVSADRQAECNSHRPFRFPR